TSPSIRPRRGLRGSRGTAPVVGVRSRCGRRHHSTGRLNVARHEHLIAGLCFSIVAVVLTGPALVGRSALGPESILDWDPLLRTQPVPPFPPAIDCTPILLHFPKDLSFARGLHGGRVDAWNPLAGCGMPLWAEQSGPFFPLKLPFYVAPSRQSYDLFLA